MGIPPLPNNGFNVPFMAGTSNAMRPQMVQQQAQLPASNVMPNQNFNPPPAQYIEPNNQQFNNPQNNTQQNNNQQFRWANPYQPQGQAQSRPAASSQPAKRGRPRKHLDEGDQEEGQRASKRPRLQQNHWQPPLMRITHSPHVGQHNPIDNTCDHCRARPNENQGCDVDLANQIECHRCTRHRALVDPNHICKVLGREHWQKRFANSRPSYPITETSSSVCVRCKAHQGSGRVALCDIDDRVKIGCTPCKNDRALCRVYDEQKVSGEKPDVDQPAEVMWNRPVPGDGTVPAGRRPWWRQMCQGCQPGKTKPCSWIRDFRLREYKCTSCVEKNIPCVDPWTAATYDTPYTWAPGDGDKIVYDKGTKLREGRHRCTNCVTNQAMCRSLTDEEEFACVRCTSWGLVCQMPGNGSRHPSRQLPWIDRKRIGWSGWTKSTANGKGMKFRGCLRCRENGYKCDRKRPCDTCVNDRAEADCDSWVMNRELVRRKGTDGVEQPEYYMALGYGPKGINDDRMLCLEANLLGPDRPRYAVMTDPAVAAAAVAAAAAAVGAPAGAPGPAPVTVGNSPMAAQQDPRQFGGVVGNGPGGGGGMAPLPRPMAATGQPGFAALPDPMAYHDPIYPYGNQDYIRNQQNNMMYGDNNTAAMANQTGGGFSDWVSGYNANINQAGPSQNVQPPPFQGHAHNQDDIQYMMGNGYDINPENLVQMAEAQPVLIHPQLEVDSEREQSELTRGICDFMAQLARDGRFVPVELRNFSPPEVAETPAAARIGPPALAILELTDQDAAETPREPPGPPTWNPAPYVPQLRAALARWKRPANDVFHDISDASLLNGSQPDNQPCEEVKPSAPGNVCNALVPDGAHCENLEHAAAQPKPHVVCEGCDLASRKHLFEGQQPLTRTEFLNMRNYACGGCSHTRQADVRFGGRMPNGQLANPLHPVTGCLCASKLLGRRLCSHHRYQLAQRLMVQVSMVLEWAITNFGPDMCLFCKQGGDLAGSVAESENGIMNDLLYVCLNCEGIVGVNGPKELVPGVEEWIGGCHPFSLYSEPWMQTPVQDIEWDA
ncbi:hypothetical protein COL5a_007588 [Colletotrichum fioriniae]|uniref:uncharacterized protein n=1 Tax=Colletotrichum fioriniae TaxID=710243 RepID=UPI0032D9FCA9|nr:hypothetical protein COL5a_007588 [Colletotrichum fioriniae]KAJ3942806.1 hypothetical protein N0V96_007030 [Colletotrichum fioriniae]